MLIAVLAGFALAILAPVVSRVGPSRAGWLMGLLPSGLFLYFARFIPQVQAGEKVFHHYPWLSDLGMDLSFLLDGLSLLFALMITAISSLVCIYSDGYLGGHRDAGKFYSTLLAFMASMLGLVLADNLIGAATKSAQVPFHFWLPNAMEAPTPVSTYLHSATMVKAGVYLLARFTPILGGTEVWQGALMAMGAATMVLGPWLAVFQTDLKRILAYTTVSSLGLFILLIGMGTAAALQACMVFLLAHSMYKGGLFLVAGIIDHGAGTRNAMDLGQLRRAMPITCAAALLLFFSNAGVPPFLGFLGKEMFLESALDAPFPRLLASAVVWTSLASVAMAGIVGLRPFFRSRSRLRKEPHEAPFGMWMGPLILGSLGLFLGSAPQFVQAPIIAPAVWASLGQTVSVQLPPWHGLDLKVLLSFLALVLGGILFWKWDTVRESLANLDFSRKYGPAALYDASLRVLESFAHVQTRFFQSGYLNRYLLMVIGTSSGFLAWSLARDGLDIPGLKLERWTNTRLHEIIIALVLLGATFVVVRASSPLVAIVALGVVGYGVALVFLLFSAPDLAMTQFAIETLSVILLVLVLLKLPRYKAFSTISERFRDALVALSGGAVTTILVIAVTASERKSKLVDYFAENSLILAKGRNVVNVILVDFRGFDTLGEITVLSAAAIGVYALIKLRLNSNDQHGTKGAVQEERYP